MDSEEDEVFFGQQSTKEEQGLKSKNLKLLRRTLQGVIRPQNSPQNAPFNPIQEEDIENNIDVDKGAINVLGIPVSKYLNTVMHWVAGQRSMIWI